MAREGQGYPCYQCDMMMMTVSMTKTVQFQTIQFSISTQFKCKNSLIVKTVLFLAIQFSQAVLIQLIQFSICLHTVKCQNSSTLNNSFWCKYSFNVNNSSISNHSVEHKYCIAVIQL